MSEFDGAQLRKTWRDELGEWLKVSASQLDDAIDIRWRDFRKRMGIEGIPQLQPYIGYGNAQRIWLHGRVLTNPPAELPDEDDTWWENIANTYRRLASDEVPGCSIEIRLGDVVTRVVSDREGYFHVNSPHVIAESRRGLWSLASMQIVDHPLVSPEKSTAIARLMIPPADARFGVISDVDDTIMHTGATRLLTMAKLTFLHNARTRLPLVGAATLYEMLHAGGKNPLFYVSSSPWNLFDLLEDFIELNRLPLGPILLRDLGFDENKFLKEGHDHKLDKVRNILATYDDLPFVLIGDSGQEDARLYATAAEEFPDRIRAIFIRDIDPLESSARDEVITRFAVRASNVEVPMFLIQDSGQAAEIAASLDLIDDADVETVRKATKTDEDRSAV